ncbi:NCS2 family permease [Waltera intestinalis]|jgi:AGZA family xanthine/uracil permease-like MFS transporter|uniref:NCS2 family permease n=1 Tax=Waltera intestinalis TaxID=2606635 RepID=A0A6L5YLC3_9FIRM|nr:NCS2 family permease [Waltera intestinalis]MBO5161369.1 NCS2 family permease [Lachnospiraceae bacterium]MCI6517223.1 NCS2 family permease [Lachnospiraceae bacterium]MST59061.1 NCS2 family permease [Waltera intestinalis]
MLEKIFKLKENNTTAKTEIIAGLTTFMTMAYIIALNPNLLTGFGKDTMPELWNGVFLATCIASAIGTIVMAFLANKPFAMAPGMGLNSFFAVVVTNIVALTGMTYVASFQSALCIVLIEGIVFLVLSVLNIREKIVDAIPLGVRLGIAPAIGLMLLNIGVGSNAGIYSENGGPFYAMRDFFGALTPSLAKTNMGSGYSAMVLSVVTMFVGLFAIVVLAQRGVKGAVLLGMLISSIIYWAGEAIFLGTNPFASLATASFVPAFGDMASTTLFKFDFRGFAEIGWFTAITLIITFCIIDMFDTIGTLVGTASRAGMLDKNGKMPNMKQALLSDAVGTVAGSLTGTSTVTTFVESASGVEAGGRTGLTALTTGIMFLACIFIAPIAGIIPAAATSSALIYVGVLMVAGLKNVDFDDICQSLPVALMMIAMPISGSIGHAIGLGLITYTVIKVFTGKAKDVSVLTYVLSLIFLLKFFIVA